MSTEAAGREGAGRRGAGQRRAGRPAVGRDGVGGDGAVDRQLTPPDETRWLDADEQRTWRAFLGATRLLFDQLDRELQRGAGLPHSYYEILVRLSEAPGRSMRMNELAEGLLSSRSRLSHAMARLEEAGWVRRDPSDTDRRGFVARLTDEGFAALAAAAPGHVEGVRTHLFDQLTLEQVQQLREISEAVLAHLGGPEALNAARAPADGS